MFYFRRYRHACAGPIQTRRRDCGKSLHYQSRGHHSHGGGNFGVRRPLRYLSYQLDLDESQTRKVASILNRLKTEQEQVALDHKRSVAALADLLTGDEPLDEELRVALHPRMNSAEHMCSEVGGAIKSLYAVLDSDQRERLADLLSSGSIAL